MNVWLNIKLHVSIHMNNINVHVLGCILFDCITALSNKHNLSFKLKKVISAE